ncbi:hypothetical protein BDR04DRAFT_1145090 [Suillus decipiens]|nr:hypothetical protein BDR04DRAFT_1145090 [Suillus decipiens]
MNRHMIIYNGGVAHRSKPRVMDATCRSVIRKAHDDIENNGYWQFQDSPLEMGQCNSGDPGNSAQPSESLAPGTIRPQPRTEMILTESTQNQKNMAWPLPEKERCGWWQVVVGRSEVFRKTASDILCPGKERTICPRKDIRKSGISMWVHLLVLVGTGFSLRQQVVATGIVHYQFAKHGPDLLKPC